MFLIFQYHICVKIVLEAGKVIHQKQYFILVDTFLTTYFTDKKKEKCCI